MQFKRDYNYHNWVTPQSSVIENIDIHRTHEYRHNIKVEFTYEHNDQLYSKYTEFSERLRYTKNEDWSTGSTVPKIRINPKNSNEYLIRDTFRFDLKVTIIWIISCLTVSCILVLYLLIKRKNQKHI